MHVQHSHELHIERHKLLYKELHIPRIATDVCPQKIEKMEYIFI